MKMASKLFAATVLAAATSFSATANATVFSIDYEPTDGGTRVWSAYDSENETYGMKFIGDAQKDGFWLVVTDGDNPKGDGSSHAILYGDIENNRITAYSYTGENNSRSYQNGTLLGTYENAFTQGPEGRSDGDIVTMFSLDVADLNGALGEGFEGVQISDTAGIWFHQSAGTEFTYGADGSITDYVFDSQMWLDRGNDVAINRGTITCDGGTATGIAENGRTIPNFLDSCNATQLAGNTGGTSSGGGSVPAPGGLALILVGLAGLGRKFRKKA